MKALHSLLAAALTLPVAPGGTVALAPAGVSALAPAGAAVLARVGAAAVAPAGATLLARGGAAAVLPGAAAGLGSAGVSGLAPAGASGLASAGLTALVPAGAAAAGVAAVLTTAAGPALAQQDPGLAARSALNVLQAASRQLEEARKDRDKVTALTAVITAYEAGLAALRDGMRQLSVHEAALSRRLAGQDAGVARLLSAMLALEATPAPLLMLHPSGPVGAARSGMVLAGITPDLTRQADELRAQLEDVRAVRALQQAALTQLGTGLREVQEARSQLSQAMAARTVPPGGAADLAQAVASLAGAALTLEEFANGLMALPSGAGQVPGAMTPPLLPVQGRLLRGFGEADAAGVRRQGWLFATAPQALVTAPAPATIRYLGPLLDYGKVMILEPEADILLVLAGLDQVYGNVGDVVDSGDPIGLMGGQPPGSQDFLAAASGAETAGLEMAGPEAAQASLAGSQRRSETLYLEVRRGGQAVDPGIWFEGTKDAN